MRAMPVMVAYARTGRSGYRRRSPSTEAVGGWMLRYTGGPTATPVAPDGTRLRLDAHARPHGLADDTMLALVRVPGGREHLIHVRAKRSEARSYFRSRGFGRFRRYELTRANDPQGEDDLRIEWLRLEEA